MIILIQNQKRDTVVTLCGNIEVEKTENNYIVKHDETVLGEYVEQEKAYWILDFLAKLPDMAVHRLEKGKRVIGVAPSNLEFIQMPE